MRETFPQRSIPAGFPLPGAPCKRAFWEKLLTLADRSSIMLIDRSSNIMELGMAGRKRDISGERRRQIIDGALQVFSSRGFAQATNKEIAQAAGIRSPGLIY